MPHIGEISALLTAVLWSGSSMVFAAASVRVGSVLVNTSRLVLALIYLVLLALVAQLDVILSFRQVLLLGLSGVVGLTIGDSFLFRAYQQIGARISMLIMSIAPAISALLAYAFLGESLSILGVVGIFITLAGVVLVVVGRPGAASSSPPVSVEGTLLAIGAAVGQGVSLVLVKLAFGEGPINGFVAAMFRIALALVILIPVVGLTRRVRHPLRTFSFDRRALMLTAAGSVMGPFLGITLSLVAVAHTRVGIAATLMATVPIIMLPLVRFVHKEVLSWKSVAGAFIAVTGVAVLFLR